MTTDIEKELFAKYQVNTSSHPCVCGMSVVIGISKCDDCKYLGECTHQIYPEVTSDKILHLYQIALRHYCISIMDSNKLYSVTASPTFECGADEAYFRIQGVCETLTGCICYIIISIFDDLTPEERSEVRKILEE